MDMPEDKTEKDKDGKEKKKKVVVEEAFDPKKLISYVNNPKFQLTEQRRELDLLEKMESHATSALRHRPACGSRHQIHGSRLPHADRSARSLRRTQGVSGHSGSIWPRHHQRAAAFRRRDWWRKAFASRRFTTRKGDPWDAHADIMAHKTNAKNSDQAFAAVHQGSQTARPMERHAGCLRFEFGRTPVREVGGGGHGVKRGRDHNPFGFTMWLAGGAVKGGTIYGATDDFGFKAMEKPAHVHDIHATILYLMGIDHRS